jgi:hypothetical protein
MLHFSIYSASADFEFEEHVVIESLGIMVPLASTSEDLSVILHHLGFHGVVRGVQAHGVPPRTELMISKFIGKPPTRSYRLDGFCIT